MDALITAFQKHFPQTGIGHEPFEWKVICANFLPFLTSFLTELGFEGTSFVCDTYHITPDAAAELRRSQGITPVFLGFPRIDEIAKLQCIRTFRDAHEWTDKKSDIEMLALVRKFKIESCEIQDACVRLNIPFFDSGADFDLALSEAFNLLIKST